MSKTPVEFFQAIQDIQKWLVTIPLPGEAVVRQAIVLRLLQVAGFNIWNPAEVVPEETTKTGSRADFLVRTPNERFALELKGMNITLSPKDYEQVATYAANESTRWAILTNGLIWSVMDTTYNPANPFHEREVLKVEWDAENLNYVAEDLFSLLSAKNWQTGEFSSIISDIKVRQQKRRNIAKVLAEKRPEVEEFQTNTTIADFEKAAILYAQLGKITEEERDILLGKFSKDLSNNLAALSDIKHDTILFTLRHKTLYAKAEYNPFTRIWTVLPGSQFTESVKPYVSNIVERRKKLLASGKIQETKDGFVCIDRIDYKTPSAAAGDLAGDSISGWDNWIDKDGNTAQQYRPKNPNA